MCTCSSMIRTEVVMDNSIAVLVLTALCIAVLCYRIIHRATGTVLLLYEYVRAGWGFDICVSAEYLVYYSLSISTIFYSGVVCTHGVGYCPTPVNVNVLFFSQPCLILVKYTTSVRRYHVMTEQHNTTGGSISS